MTFKPVRRCDGLGYSLRMSARFALKAATADAHERLDALFSRFDLGDPSDYGRFLLAQADGFYGVETALERDGVADVVGDWRDRRRSGLLASDLSDLDLDANPRIATPSFPTEAALLGALYVLEGSRLGGAMLVRSVPSDLPKSFLSPGNPEAWRAFVQVLDERLSSDDDVAVAAQAANDVFDIFASSARRILGEDDFDDTRRQG